MRRAIRTSAILFFPAAALATTLIASCSGGTTTEGTGGTVPAGGSGGGTTVTTTTTTTTGDAGDGPCVDGALGCAGHTPQTCVGGQWVLSETTCTGLTPSCLDGACVACSPGTKDCGASTPRVCDATGNWQYQAPCGGELPACLDGACVECLPGNVACIGVGVEKCDPTGAWQPLMACDFGCVNAMCTGVCVPGATRCNGAKPETCSTAGVWEGGDDCQAPTGVCLDGVCVECSPGDKPCNGNVTQSCDTTGKLHDEETCAYTCSAGACAGDCVPGTRQCNGKQAQKCTDAGQWANDGNPCAYLCVAGECKGECTPGAVGCLTPSTPKTCDANAMWQSPSSCAQPTPDCVTGECGCAPNHTSCGAACVDLLTDTENCGACGHSCDQGDCKAGKCLGYPLATMQSRPTGLALDAKYVYFTSMLAGTVSRVPLAGGPVEILATGQSSPQGIAVDANNVYWTNPGGTNTVMRVDINGPNSPGAPVVMAAGQGGPLNIAVDATHVYWTSTSGALSKTPLGATNATAPIVLCSGAVQGTDISTPTGLALDGQHAYFTNGFYGSNTATIVRVLKANSAVSQCEVMVRNQTRPTALTFDGTSMYWTNWQATGTDSLSACPKGAYCNAPTILAAFQQMSAQFSNVQQISSDGQFVYFANGLEANIKKVPVGGGNVTKLYDTPVPANNPNAVISNATHLFWATATTVFRGVKSP